MASPSKASKFWENISPNISRTKNHTDLNILANMFAHLSSFISQLVDFFVKSFDFYFYLCDSEHKVKNSNSLNLSSIDQPTRQ